MNRITVHFDNHSITYPSIDLHPGFHLITGASGKGKTTLLRVFHGLQEAQNKPQISSETALMPQHPVWVDYATMHEHLKMMTVTNFEEDVQMLGISDLLHRFPHELSIGQLQRFALVLALHQGASLLLLDEPTSALDDDWAEKACELLDYWLSANPQGRIYAVTHDHRMKERFNLAKTIAL